MGIAINNLLCKYDYLFSDNYYVIYEEVNSYGNNYLDITKEWINNPKSNSHKVKNKHYFEYEKVKYRVDNKNVVLDYSDKEKEVAIWLENTFGGEIYMLPRINIPNGIMTADYLFRREYWDLKTINGSGKRVIEDSIKKKKRQAENFIFDITNSEIEKDNLFKQLKKIYSSDSTKWVSKVIVKKQNTVIGIFKRN